MVHCEELAGSRIQLLAVPVVELPNVITALQKINRWLMLEGIFDLFGL